MRYYHISHLILRRFEVQVNPRLVDVLGVQIIVVVFLVVLLLFLLWQLITAGVPTAKVSRAPSLALRVAEALLVLPLAARFTG